MYVEISGRRTGKTSRCVRAFNNCTAMHKAIVAGHPEQYARLNHVPIGSVIAPVDTLRIQKTLKDYVLFWDEFDQKGSDYTALIKDTDFYYTTPASYRDSESIIQWAYGYREDMLLTLVQKVGKDLKKYTWNETPFLEDCKNTMNTVQYLQQHLGIYQITVEQAMGFKNATT